jgi:hypothetical protein
MTNGKAILWRYINALLIHWLGAAIVGAICCFASPVSAAEMYHWLPWKFPAGQTRINST